MLAWEGNSENHLPWFGNERNNISDSETHKKPAICSLKPLTCNNGVFGDTLTVCLLPLGARTVTDTPLAAILPSDVTLFVWINFIDHLNADTRESATIGVNEPYKGHFVW